MRPGVLIAGIALISAICFFRSYNELGHLSKLKRALRTGDDVGSNEHEEGRLAIPDSQHTGWPDKEICVIWWVTMYVGPLRRWMCACVCSKS